MDRVRMIPGAVESLARSSDVRDVLESAAKQVAENARRGAPRSLGRRDTRKQAIDYKMVMTADGWEANVGHVVLTYGFWLARIEFGTRYHRAQPHLRPAAYMPVNI